MNWWGIEIIFSFLLFITWPALTFIFSEATYYLPQWKLTNNPGQKVNEPNLTFYQNISKLKCWIFWPASGCRTLQMLVKKCHVPIFFTKNIKRMKKQENWWQKLAKESVFEFALKHWGRVIFNKGVENGKIICTNVGIS